MAEERTWDETELRGPVTGERYGLYVVLDLFGRYPLAWMLDTGNRTHCRYGSSAPSANGTESCLDSSRRTVIAGAS